MTTTENQEKKTIKAVKSRVLKTEYINWRKAKWLQNDNLKDLGS